MPTTTTGVATSFIDFTRASNATVTDSDGKVKWAPHNLLTNSESFDAASWVKAVSTVAANTHAAPNGTTTADTLTATSLNGWALSNYTALGSVSYTFGVWLKRKTGTGNIQITTDDNLTWTTVTITSDWALYTVAQSPTSGTKSAGVRIVTSGDEVYVWGAHLYRSDLAMQLNTSAYPMYNPTTVKNLLGYTEDFSNAAWADTISGSGVAPVVTANAGLSPNGLQTADRIQFSLGGGTSTSDISWRRQSFSTIANTPYAFSFYAKSFNGSTYTLNITNAIGVAVNTVTVTNEWQRFSAIANGVGGFVGFGLGLRGGQTPTNSNTADVLVWGAQLSDSASLDSYVPVYGAAVTSAAYYGPRRDFDSAGVCKGLLVEEQRANLQLNSNVFGTSTFATTVASGAAASPSGLIDASSLACTSTTGRAILSTSVTSGVVYTFSAFIKAGTNTSAYIELAGTAGSGGPVVFNLSNGTVTSGTGGAIVPAPNGFYRCSVTSTATGTGASDIRIGTGDATSKTIFVYGAQVEAGSFATSYIPVGSTTAGATRNADVASVSTQAFPYSATEGTLVMNFDVYSITSPNNQWITLLGGSSDYIGAMTNPSSFRGLVVTGGASQASMINGSVASNTPLKGAIAFKADDFATTSGGAAVVVDTAGTLPTVNKMQIGNFDSSNYLNGHIRQITYIPRRLSNAELQTRTA